MSELSSHQPKAEERTIETAAFLFTDIEGSTQLLQEVGDERYHELLECHRELVRGALSKHGGEEVQTEGDSFFVAFRSAPDALRAAVAAQVALTGYDWPPEAVVRVRMGMHAGSVIRRDDDYAGLTVHQAHRVSAVAHGGQILCSAAVCELAGGGIDDITLGDLGEHRLKDLARPTRLYQVHHPDLPSSFPPPRSMDHLPNNLPVQLTSFIGREQEMTALSKVLEEARLLTLTGPGGTGKTRLALQTAADLLGRYEGGVWFVSLASIGDPEAVSQKVAESLRLPEAEGRTVTTVLKDALRSRRLLLVLDNCEHVVDGCAELADELLRECPELTVLATSRQALGVDGEAVWPVPPLPVPAEGDLPPVDSWLDHGAVWLFVERAHAVDPRFRLDEDNAAAVGEICRRLDGIPLAIELAASRTKALGPGQIVRRLEGVFSLLTGGSRTSLPHHRTLQATIDWSHELLSEDERVLFRRLSVFSGSFPLDAVEEVCAAPPIEPFAVMDLLGALVDKSLVVVEPHGDEVRYRLLDTIRQYGADRIGEAERSDEFKERHFEHYLALAKQADAELHGPDQAEWLRRLDEEHDNLRGALRWALEAGRAEAAVEMVWCLEDFWSIRGHWTEALSWADRALGSSGLPSGSRGRGLVAAAGLRVLLGGLSDAKRDLEEALPIVRSTGDREAEAACLYHLGSLAYLSEPPEAVRQLHEAALSLYREIGHGAGVGSALNALGILAYREGDLDISRAIHEEALAAFQAIGDDMGVVRTIEGHLQWHAMVRGQHEKARELSEEALGTARRLGMRTSVPNLLRALGGIALKEGDVDRAEALLDEALEELGDLDVQTSESASALHHARGWVALHRGELAGALRHFQEALHDDDAHSLSGNWVMTGIVSALMGDLRGAEEAYAEGLDIALKLGSKHNVVECHAGMARIAMERGDLDGARALLGEQEAAAKELEAANSWLMGRGELARLQGRHDEARVLLQEALRDSRKKSGDDPPGALLGIGRVALECGDIDEAKRCFEDALEQAKRAPARPWLIAEGLEGRAAAAAREGGLEEAAELLGSAAVIRERIGAPVPLRLRADHERVRDEVREELGDDAFSSAYERGRAASPF